MCTCFILDLAYMWYLDGRYLSGAEELGGLSLSVLATLPIKHTVGESVELGVLEVCTEALPLSSSRLITSSHDAGRVVMPRPRVQGQTFLPSLEGREVLCDVETSANNKFRFN